MSDKSITFSTLEVSTTPGMKHLEHWPAGFSLCGIDLFPTDGPTPGFSRKGGTSSWDELCPECIRHGRRYGGQYTVSVTGMFGGEFEVALLGDETVGEGDDILGLNKEALSLRCVKENPVGVTDTSALGNLLEAREKINAAADQVVSARLATIRISDHYKIDFRGTPLDKVLDSLGGRLTEMAYSLDLPFKELASLLRVSDT